MKIFVVLILGGLQFGLEIFVGINLLMVKCKRRSFFPLRIILSLICLFPTYFLDGLYFAGFSWIYLVQYIYVGLLAFFLYDENILKVIGFATSAYAIQNIASTSYFAFCLNFPNDTADFYYFFSYYLIYVIVYFVAFLLTYFVLSKYNSRVNPLVIVTSTVIILLTTIMSQFAKSYSSDALPKFIYEILCSFFALVIHYGVGYFKYVLDETKNLSNEKSVLQNMLYQQEKQQKMTKEMIEIINVKCHDLKKQLTAFESIDEEDRHEYLKEIKKAVNIYGKIVKTGNAALDIVLTQKGLICESNKINFNYLVNPSSLDFMNEVDIWSLFGNAIDNAIEAVENEKEDERIIRLNVNEKGKFVIVHIENYCSKNIQFEDGLPITSKKDKNFHGFGIKSILNTVEKYNGNSTITYKNNLFILNMMFPNPLLKEIEK